MLMLAIVASLSQAVSSVARAAGPAGTRLEYTTSWLGNSLPGADGWVLQSIEDIYVTPAGMVYTNVPWDEHGGNVMAFKDERFLAEARVGNRGGGSTITANDTYIFFGGNRHRKGSPGIDRRDRADIFDKSKNVHVDCGTVHGIVTTGDRVFASVPEEDKIKVFDLALRPVTEWAVKDPSELAIDHQEKIWVIQRSLQQVTRYDQKGNQLAQTISLGQNVVPTDICQDNQGRLLIADEGVGQQIHVYTNIDDIPEPDGRIGIAGGVFAGPVSGKKGTMRFFWPRGIGCDSVGNLYVANRSDVNNNCATCIQCYSSEGELQWEVSASLWIDCVDVDPENPNVLYGSGEKFVMDYSADLGKEATLAAYTANPFAFPDDPRIGGHGEHSQRGATWMRSVQGAKLMYLTSMSGLPICIYRFQPEKYGEIGVPCGFVDGTEIWTDLNGDGHRQDNEVEPINIGNGMGAWVDSQGTIWHCDRGGFERLVMQKINTFGVPVYRAAVVESFPLPEPFTELRRIRFYPERDNMLILNGFTKECRNISHHGKRAGKVFRRFDNWAPDRWRLTWEFVPPFEDRTTGNFGDGNIQALAIAGDYLFLAPNGCSDAMGINRGHIDVYDLDSTERIGWMEPDAWIQSGNPNGQEHNVGILDINDGMNVIRRSNGEYLIFWEDDMNSKNLMYRWRPEVDKNR